jgi:adenine specific DNA methylase Mod
MSNIYEQRFFSALKDTFIGHPIKGKSGYVNLMAIKAKYFADIEPYIQAEIESKIEAGFREELFEKLYSFFDCYLNETGTVFFANSQLHKNLYEKVYSDRDDVALFWKTQKLYYVKSEANYEDLQTDVNGIKILFDASEIKHAKGNEKKAIQFFLTKATKDEVIFKVRYQENNKYDRLKEYLELKNNNDIIDKCLDEYGASIHPNIVFAKTELDPTVFERKTDSRKCIYFENIDDALKSVKVEFSVNDYTLMLHYLHKKGIILYEEDLKKIFTIYKRQNEIDYFIHKDAEGFLKEQFDIYVYNWLFNDLETDFDAATVKRMQNIKKIAHKVIEYIARFEDELKAIWEKPKFVRNSNYVLTIDNLFPFINKPKGEIFNNETTIIRNYSDSKGLEILTEIFNHEGIQEQKKEWNKDIAINDLISKNSFNERFKYLTIDTKHFKSLEIKILSVFDNIEEKLNGKLIKTDNWQGINSIRPAYANKVKTIYIDPPFNKENEADYKYKVKYKNSTWNTILDNRLNISKHLLKDEGSYFVRCDYNGNFFVKLLLDKALGDENYRNEIVVNRFKRQLDELSRLNFATESLFYYGKSSRHTPNKMYRPRNCTFCGQTLEPSWRPMSSPGLRESPIEDAHLDLFPSDVIIVDENGKKKTMARIIGGNVMLPPKGRHWTFKQSRIFEMEKNRRLRINKSIAFKDINGNRHEGLPEYLQTDETPIDTTWTDLKGYAFGSNFSTENAEELLKRVILFSSNIGDTIVDFFLGSGTTIAVAQKLSRKWIGMEIGDHFYSYILPRMKDVLAGFSIGISSDEDVKWQGGGFFKYYELEQYEEVLARAKYQWQGKEGENSVEQYSFLQDEKLLDAIEIDYQNKNAKVVFERLYPDVDIAETLSNVSGKHIKQIFEDKVVFEDGSEVVYAEMTFEKYPWIKPLIWWNSK